MGKIFSLNEFKDKKFFKEEEKQFKKYLQTLKQDELQYEADHILSNIDKPEVSEDFLLKSALLIEELADRVDSLSMSDQISQYSEHLREKLSEIQP